MKYRVIIFFTILTMLAVLSSCFESTNPSTGNDPSNYGDYETPINLWVDNGEIVGAEILIIQDENTLVHEVAGFRDKERNLPFEKNTICRIRSMTKPVIGTAILMLMEDGELSLDDEASLYISEFDNDQCREITIMQLLKHTAGFQQPGYPGWAGNYNSLQEVVQALADAGPTYTPGSRFSYSDGCTSTLAYIVTQVSGVPVEDFIQTRIFNPLQMYESFCMPPQDDSLRTRVSCTYSGGTNNWVKYWDNFDPPQVSYFRGSGGIFTTVSDYSNFLSMWLNNGTWNSICFLDSATVQMAITPSEESIIAGKPFGLHWEIYSDPIFSHTGSDGTLGSVDPSMALIVLYFSQSRGNVTLYRMSYVINMILN